MIKKHTDSYQARIHDKNSRKNANKHKHEQTMPTNSSQKVKITDLPQGDPKRSPEAYYPKTFDLGAKQDFKEASKRARLLEMKWRSQRIKGGLGVEEKRRIEMV